MKKLILTVFLVATGLFAIFLFRSQSSEPSPQIIPLPPPQASPSLLIDTMDQITFQDQVYHYAWVKIDNPDNLRLYPNFTAQSSSQELINQNHCSVLVNGGFYGQDDQPIGWLISDSQLVSSSVKSRLLNGYFSLDDGRATISAVRSQTAVSLGLQSGPLLIFNSKPLLLNIKDDEPRRRIIIATTTNELIFFAIVGQDSLFTGPLLTDTPALISAITETIGKKLTAALNLDGGSASVFYTPNIHIKEFTWFASYFCAAL